MGEHSWEDWMFELSEHWGYSNASCSSSMALSIVHRRGRIAVHALP